MLQAFALQRNKQELSTHSRKKGKKRVKSLVWHTKSMHESIKMNAFGALWGKGERRMASKEGDKSERWHTLKRREMDADRGGEGGKGRKRGAECSFKWKLALSLMAGTSNDDTPPPTPPTPDYT